MLPMAVESFGTTCETGLKFGTLGGAGHDWKVSFGFLIVDTPRWAAISATDLGRVAFGSAGVFPGGADFPGVAAFPGTAAFPGAAAFFTGTI